MHCGELPKLSNGTNITKLVKIWVYLAIVFQNNFLSSKIKNLETCLAIKNRFLCSIYFSCFCYLHLFSKSCFKK